MDEIRLPAIDESEEPVRKALAKLRQKVFGNRSQ